MIEQHREQSLMDEILADPRGRAEMALADLELRMSTLLTTAFRLRGDVEAQGIADIFEIPVERVEVFLEGDESLPAEVFARYVRVLGYVPVLNLMAVDDDAPELPDYLGEHWRGAIVDTYVQIGASSDGSHPVTVDAHRPHARVESIGDPVYVSSYDVRSRTRFHDSRAWNIRQETSETSEEEQAPVARAIRSK
jgi:hypothetical protein